jgi:protein-L-isoaspartate(D-aspartate) O-methyltransferase
MTTVTQTTATSADQLRAAMVDRLLADGHITSLAVEHAFRTVAREQFAPAGTDLQTLYNLYEVVITKRGPDGLAMSSISAPSIQAFMIEQAQLRPGMRILEIGSRGVQAAHVAEIVGPAGRVTTLDIDPDITDHAAACLDTAGYGSRVRVRQGDGHYGVPDEAPFDVILTSVQCWDLAPPLLEQLAPTGVLVLPLTLRGGVSRSIAFRRDGDRWTSHDAKMCGFVPMRGVDRRVEHRVSIDGPDGTEVFVSFDTEMPHGLHLDHNLLAEPPIDVWSGVPFPHHTSWADLYLFFACYLDGFCRLSTPEGTGYPASKSKGLPYAAVRDNSIAHLTFRPLDDPDDGIEFGARGFGAGGKKAAQAIIDQVQAWNATARGAEPWFSYVPTHVGEVGLTPGVVALPKVYGTVLIHWPLT